MVLKRVLVMVLVLALVVLPGLQPVADATVASGAVTGRGVFSLTASGAAKVGLAESQVAAAVRVLGMLGRVSSVVTVGFVAYEVTSGLWDWWNATYDAGAAYPTATPGMAGTFGVQSGVDIGDCQKYQWSTAPGGSPTYFYDLTVTTSCPPAIWSAVVGQTGSSWVDVYGWVHRAVYLHGLNAQLPSSSVGQAAPGSSSGRAEFVAAVDGAVSDLTTMSQADLDWAAATAGASTAYSGSSLDALTSTLNTARTVVSGGVALTGSDVTVVNAGASTGTMPGVIPGPGETTGSDLSAISAAIAASQAAVIAAVAAVGTAVAAIPAAITAAQTAVISAVQSASSTLSAAIAASQAAVLAAVESVRSAVVGVENRVDSVGAKVDAVKADLAEMQSTAASPASAFVCPSCTRTESWVTLMQSWQAAAASAPIFGLIAHLAWPGAGSVQRQWSLGFWQGHQMSIDLDNSGIGTVVTVVRFVVVGGAVIVAYMIIFA